MRPPAALIRAGVDALPCIGDGRQSGTSGSPSILNASPEAAVGGGLAILRDGDRIRVDLKTRSVNLLVSDAELAERRAALAAEPFRFPEDQTPWQALQPQDHRAVRRWRGDRGRRTVPEGCPSLWSAP
jgi:dihydroxy-acid dehydratase